MGVGGAGGGHHLLVAGLGAAIANVVHGAGRKHRAVLWNDADAVAQLIEAEPPDRHTVQFDAAFLRIVKTHEQLEHGALARPTGARAPDRKSTRLNSSHVKIS